MKRIPILPTLVVVVAIAVMIGLGVWQIGRATEKEAALAAIAAAKDRPPVDLDQPVEELAAMSQAAVTCTLGGAPSVRAGQNLDGQTGYRYIYTCTPRAGAEIPGIRTLFADVGWSQRSDERPAISGAQRYTGTLWNRGNGEAVLTLSAALPPLQASKPPAVENIPNNHIMYAVQWFFFAAVAGIIYALALRRRLREGRAAPTSARS